MDYISGNKEAWEEAFENRAEGWGDDIVRKVRGEPYAFFEKEMAEALKKRDFRGKTVAQLCCNNGRELLSLVASSGARNGHGFDIAENQVAFANGKAAELGIDCRFTAINVLEIGGEYDGAFDAIIVTIGALCWFRHARDFFAVASWCLRDGGMLFVNEQHPLTTMLAMPGEDNFDEAHPAELVNPYFYHEWIGNGGMWYMTKKNYESKTFTDYTHSVSEILNGVISAGMAVTGFDEIDADISGAFGHLSGRELPLSYVLTARKSPK